MVKLRLMPIGKSAQPFFRVVAIDARAKLNGKYIDIVGHYDPIKKIWKIDEERAIKFLMTGAQPTSTVRTVLSKNGTIAKFNELKLANQKTKKQQVKTIKAKQKQTTIQIKSTKKASASNSVTTNDQTTQLNPNSLTSKAEK